ncbi:MAG TPA: T9SS type A sorting domain-containing protein, partial [Candidatus Kapabacteria bacterium]
ANVLWKSTYYNDPPYCYTPQEPPHTLLTWHEVIGGPSNDELVLKLCDSASFWTWFQFKSDSCNNGGLTGITIEGLDSAVASYTVSGVWHPWDEYPDTPKITIVPNIAGTFPVLVHLHYSDDDFNEGDTAFPLTVIIQPSPGELTVNAPAIFNFGTQSIASAKLISKTFSLTAAGCERVVVDSIRFVPDSVAFIDFNFTTVSRFVPNALPSTFTLSFKPTIADSERGKVLIDWSDGENGHVDTILALGVGVSGLASVENSPGSQGSSMGPIAPNPATNEITIVVAEDGDHHAFIISDPLGRRYIVPQNGNVLDISSLPSGVYFVSDGASAAKFIKE